MSIYGFLGSRLDDDDVLAILGKTTVQIRLGVDILLPGSELLFVIS